jgi:hypothetical protein
LKLWHLLAATAWVAVFLGLARTAARQLMVPHGGFMDGVESGLIAVAAWHATLPVVVRAWCFVGYCDFDDVDDKDRAGCLGVFTAMAVVLAAIGLFCWFGAG